MKQNKLNYICTKLSELDNYFVWLNYEFDLLGIKCTIAPWQVSEYIEEFHTKAMEEKYHISEGVAKDEFSKLGKGNICRILEEDAI
ncbi:MAG: hypothetical protein OES14_02905 [Nitrosopumilus sp.]|nr:hypothetical protein [Nitrosopumilus sp.]